MPTIPLAFSLVALLLSLLLCRDRTSFDRRKASRTGGAVLVVGTLLLLATHFLQPADSAATVWGIALGGTLGLAAGLMDGFVVDAVAALGLACAASGILASLPSDSVRTASLGAIASCGAVAWLMRSRTSSLLAVAVCAVGLQELLSPATRGAPVQNSPSMLALEALTLVALVRTALLRTRVPKTVVEVGSAALLIGAVALVARTNFSSNKEWFALICAPLATLAVAWMDRETQRVEPFKLILCAVVWISVGTIAFGAARALGMGFATLAAVGAAVAIDSSFATLSAGPLIALAFNRAFQVQYPGVGGAIDIGQHYALIGFLLAALVPLLPAQWMEDIGDRLRGLPATAGAALWLLVCLGAPAWIALFLAPKGLLGFVTGLGFSAFFSLAMRGRDLSVPVLASSVAAVSVLEYGLLEKFSDLGREPKLQWLLIASVGLCGFAGVLWLLSYRRPAASPNTI